MRMQLICKWDANEMQMRIPRSESADCWLRHFRPLPLPASGGLGGAAESGVDGASGGGGGGVRSDLWPLTSPPAIDIFKLAPNDSKFNRFLFNGAIW